MKWTQHFNNNRIYHSLCDELQLLPRGQQQALNLVGQFLKSEIFLVLITWLLTPQPMQTHTVVNTLYQSLIP